MKTILFLLMGLMFREETLTLTIPEAEDEVLRLEGEDLTGVLYCNDEEILKLDDEESPYEVPLTKEGIYRFESPGKPDLFVFYSSQDYLFYGEEKSLCQDPCLVYEGPGIFHVRSKKPLDPEDLCEDGWYDHAFEITEPGAHEYGEDDEKFSFYIMKEKPGYEIPGGVEISEHTYLFKEDGPLKAEILGDYPFDIEREIPLVWGENHLEALGIDENVNLILDDKAPEVSLVYEDDAFHFQIEEEYLDFHDLPETLTPGSHVTGVARDKAGNETIVDMMIPEDLKLVHDGGLSWSGNADFFACSFTRDGLAAPFHIVDRRFAADEVLDGYYQLKGELKDEYGRRQRFSQNVMIDESAPVITFKEQEISAARAVYDLSFSDRFLKEYGVVVTRNGELYFQDEGHEKVLLILDETPFQEGFGDYEISCYAQDTKQKTGFFHRVHLDGFCAPIDVRVNDTLAEDLETLEVYTPLNVQSECAEGTVTWEVYEEDRLLRQGTDQLILDPESPADRVVFSASDPAGHITQKELRLEHAQPVFLTPPRLYPVVGKRIPHFEIFVMIGGGLVAAGVIGWLAFSVLARARRHRHDLSECQTEDRTAVLDDCGGGDFF